ncbi:MAG: antibiotic biosynthesis monooxygenase [Candidatus Dormibacteraeota bacterium]|nr:antibiotic biosynthesis monooxygenase [Candidatus Dormibacteraeota bacterium]
MTRVKGSPDRLDEAIADYEKSVAGPARSQPGFQGIALLVNRQTGEAISITYWEDEAALRASQQFADKARAESTGRTGSQVISTETAEIVDMQRTGPPRSKAYVRLNTVAGSPDKVDKAVDMYKSQVVPLLKQQRGFLAAIAGANRQTGKVVVSSVWDSEENRQASEAAVAQLRRDTGEAAGDLNVKVEQFESAFVDMPVNVAQS